MYILGKKIIPLWTVARRTHRTFNTTTTLIAATYDSSY